MNDFYMDKADLRKLERFFKESPKLLRPVSANVLTSLAFDARKLYLKQIERNMIVRNERFVKSAMRVEKARSVSIDKQIAIAGSVNKPRFTGWEEQQKGTPPKTKRTVTIAGRKGSKRNVAMNKARLKSSNKFYKPQQFAGTSMHNKFMFMMRVLNTRGGGEFIISNTLALKNGQLKPGLYQLKSHRLRRLQSFDANKTTRITWMTAANKQLKFSTDLVKVYDKSLKHVIARYAK